MTDRELLELAAKAAGVKIIKWGESDYYSHRHGEVAYVCATGKNVLWGGEWQPLDDDGDALRLAVSLRMNIDVGAKPVVFTEASVIVDAMRIGAEEYHDSDPYAATRRAIVRAAAEIGRKME